MTVDREERLQTSVRLSPAKWEALHALSRRLRIETGERVTVHDLLVEGVRFVLAAHGVDGYRLEVRAVDSSDNAAGPVPTA
jgi:hypothetical protein